MTRSVLPSERRVVKLCGGPLLPQPDDYYADLARVALGIGLDRNQTPFAPAKHLSIHHIPDSAVPAAYNRLSIQAHAAGQADGFLG